MLTETVDRFGADFSADHITLIDAFLNPVAISTRTALFRTGLARATSFAA